MYINVQHRASYGDQCQQILEHQKNEESDMRKYQCMYYALETKSISDRKATLDNSKERIMNEGYWTVL